ncbi:MAG: twin-arginine translocase TatA/TatE family subunit [Chloroflexota bacterium]|nr:twin-arginine translocase TatA/TatE family subunit [Chloroflexota bacterium]
MPHLGPWEIVAIVAVVLIIFGVGRLPQALGSLGKGVRNFRRASAGEDDDRGLAEAKSDQQKPEEKSDEKTS